MMCNKVFNQPIKCKSRMIQALFTSSITNKNTSRSVTHVVSSVNTYTYPTIYNKSGQFTPEFRRVLQHHSITPSSYSVMK